jgi:uncharacterized membrane protein YkoI
VKKTFIVSALFLIITVLILTSCEKSSNYRKRLPVNDADTVIGGQQVNNNDNSMQLINETDAKQAALQKAGVSESQVKHYKSELDFDDGIYKYGIEFYADGYEYDIDVSAHAGTIFSFDKENDSIFD